MNKKQKRYLGIIVVVGLMLFGILVNLQIVSAVSGTSYLSISDVDVVDSGQRIMILATGGSAEQLFIRFTSSELNQKLASEGYSVDNGITTDIFINKWQYTYPIQLTSNTFKTLGIQDLEPYTGSELSCDISDCSKQDVPQLGTYVFAYAYGMSIIPSKYYCKCVYYNPSERVGQFLGDISQLDYNIDFKIGSEMDSMNNNHKVVSLANGDFTAEYVGNLGTDFQRSKPSYDVLHKNSAYQNLIPPTGYNYPGEYGNIGSPQSYISECTQSLYPSTCIGSQCDTNTNTVNGCLNQYISDLFVGSANKNNEYKTNNYVESMSFLGNSLIVNSEIPTFQPVFKIFVDAEYVKLKELKGIPKITSCAPKIEIVGGTSKQVSLIVKNIGDNSGQFDYSVTCQSDQVSFSGAGSLVNSGQEATINLLFTGTNTNPTQDLIGSCNHKITDRKSQKSDTCISSYSVKYNELVCVPGQLRCAVSNNRLIEKCNELGNGWDTYQDCGNKYCNFVNGVVSCGDTPPPNKENKECASCDAFALSKILGKTGIWKSKTCEPKTVPYTDWFGGVDIQRNTTCAFSFIKIALIPIVFIFSLLFGMDFLQRFRELRGNKKKLLRLGVSFTIAVILAYLVFVTFWIGVIVFGAYIVLKAVIGGFLPIKDNRYVKINKYVRRLRR